MTEEEARKFRKQFSVIVMAALIMIGAGTIIFRHLEDQSWLDSLYFSVVALTTVGFGDITPQTNGGKIFVMVYLVIGIAIIGTAINLLLKNVAAKRVIKEVERQNNTKAKTEDTAEKD